MIYRIHFNLLGIFLLVFAACDSGSNDPSTEDEKKNKTPEPIEEEAFAFPGAEGFGNKTTGGRGGKILYVTNLMDSGPGSFREAVETTGARYVLFKVSGNLSLSSTLRIRNGDLTIAGQTAPGDGITIKNYPVIIDADNVILRFMRFRMGDEAQQQGDALEARFHKNIIIDHCSFSWATDETLTMYANENTTVQWSYITESLRNSVHEKGAHGYGGIWGGKKASFHHNLLAHHDSRNPRFGEEAGKAFALTDLVDFRNNVIYNWQGNSAYGAEAMNLNIINNYYKPGPATTKKDRIISIDKNKNVGTEIYDIWGKFYIDGNYVEGSSQVNQDNWKYGVYNQFHHSYGEVSDAEKKEMRIFEPHNIEDNVTSHLPEKAFDKVISYGGASLVRDGVDKRIADEVKTGTYTYEASNGSGLGIIDTQTDVGGWPELLSKEPALDTSGDGMPDSWKEKMGLDPERNNANGRDLSTAYDNVEVYLNSLVENIIQNQL
ncbi:hypothetical protein DET49_10121 [Salegentibacter sp. 24]|uniref:pectate lyase family protein n=1 Tax=Salegentibacter sp. 24 TaxID=2183986 RepID=UPI00105E3425|nr:pectate lyase [Salegentibacter sp. 24]TDN95426.1 hypothetical protein DET49_10121 [Salegentibacter sp. 24]